MPRRALLFFILIATALFPVPVAAETYRYVGPDGTLHMTNAPTGPGYERLGQAAGPLPATRGVIRGEEARPEPAGRYGAAIREAARRHNVPEGLVRAVIQVESRFNPGAVSPKGARGLMQLLPATASLLGVRDPHDPEQNIDGGVRHLRRLMNRFSNDLPLSLAAYHAGEAIVVASRGIPPYPDTRQYVTRVLRLFAESGQPGSFGDEPPDGSAAEDARTRDTAGGDGVTILPGSICRVSQSDGAILYTNVGPCRRPSGR